jgi:divalent metal cation (Fe/Co/Zn/Cd) transporter
MSAVEIGERGVTPGQAAEEQSLFFALAADSFMMAGWILVGVLGGSLTVIAESIRGGLMMSIEVFAYFLMRRLHRGQLTDLEFGTGKLEQVANFLIGGGMLAGAAWIFSGAVAMVDGERVVSDPIWLAVGAVTGATNLVVNLTSWDGMRRAVRTESSLVMLAQFKSRTVKLIASCFVIMTLTTAALAPDEVVVAWADAVGSVFVAGFIVVNAIGILRDCIPDLLDRSAGKTVRGAAERALARHAADFQGLERLRSRRSGRAVFVEVTLAFEAGLAMGEVNRRIAAIRATMLAEIEHGDISILASVSRT